MGASLMVEQMEGCISWINMPTFKSNSVPTTLTLSLTLNAYLRVQLSANIP